MELERTGKEKILVDQWCSIIYREHERCVVRVYCGNIQAMPQGGAIALQLKTRPSPVSSLKPRRFNQARSKSALIFSPPFSATTVHCSLCNQVMLYP